MSNEIIYDPCSISNTKWAWKKTSKAYKILLQESARLFVEKGLKGASFDDLAQAVGLSKRSVSKVGTKERLFLKAVELSTRLSQKAVFSKTEKTLGKPHKINVFFDGLAELILNNYDMMMLSFLGAQFNSEDTLKIACREFITLWESQLKKLIKTKGLKDEKINRLVRGGLVYFLGELALMNSGFPAQHRIQSICTRFKLICLGDVEYGLLGVCLS